MLRFVKGRVSLPQRPLIFVVFSGEFSSCSAESLNSRHVQVLGILLLLMNVYAPMMELRQGALAAFSFALGFGVMSLMTQGF